MISPLHPLRSRQKIIQNGSYLLMASSLPHLLGISLENQLSPHSSLEIFGLLSSLLPCPSSCGDCAIIGFRLRTEFKSLVSLWLLNVSVVPIANQSLISSGTAIKPTRSGISSRVFSIL